MDNGWWENKNRFVTAYMECPVAWKALQTVEVGFLSIVHTHADIDKMFSTRSQWLRTENSISN